MMVHAFAVSGGKEALAERQCGADSREGEEGEGYRGGPGSPFPSLFAQLSRSSLHFTPSTSEEGNLVALALRTLFHSPSYPAPLSPSHCPPVPETPSPPCFLLVISKGLESFPCLSFTFLPDYMVLLCSPCLQRTLY